jgi:FtsP/CotA-like multicopper oxidase with cupredoxin domain
MQKIYALLLASCTMLTWAQQPLHIPDTLSGAQINLNLQHGQRQFFTGPPTQTMGVNGNFLGPTIILEKHQQVAIQVNNQLNDTTTIHWHGLHVAPENDGNPHIIIPPGATWQPSFEVLDWASTYWYHPHPHGKNNDHVQLGIAGFIIVRDSAEASLNLPRTYGVDDLPLVLQTRAFDNNNQIIVESQLDTTLMVNGTLRPYKSVPAQIVRLRLLNGASERTFNLGFSNNQTFHMIGSDGGLLSAPVALSRLRLSPGERAEILVNLSALQGQNLQLRNFGSELPNAIHGASQPGMGQGQSIPGYNQNPLNGGNYDVLNLQVGAPTAQPVTTIPTALVTHQIWTANQADTTRTVTFMSMNMGPQAIAGPFMFDMMPFDMMMINHRIPFNNIEIWELRNQTPIAHPFHIHDVQFYVLDINGTPPPPHLAGRKDVILVPGGMGVVRFITQFETFYNDTLPYMYHCHMLTHEDHGMMGQFVVLPPENLSTRDAGTKVLPEIKISPVPARDYISVQRIPERNLSFQIVNPTGQVIYRGQLEPNQRDIPVSGLNAGLYFLEDLHSGAKIKFVIQR